MPTAISVKLIPCRQAVRNRSAVGEVGRLRRLSRVSHLVSLPHWLFLEIDVGERLSGGVLNDE